MQLKTILTFALIVFVLGILFFSAVTAASVLPPQDFAQFWAAAHLVRQNPYSLQLVSSFEKASGINAGDPPMVLRYPPWAMPFILPLGLFSYRTGFALWAVFSLVTVVGCAGLVWRSFENKESLFSILLPLFFGPTIILLMLGQWTILALVGVTGFLVATEQRRDWVAGAFLLLVMGKPHIALLYLLAVGLWVFQTRRWAVLYSAVLSLLASSSLMLVMNLHIFSQFLDRTREFIDERRVNPNLGGILYVVTGNHALAAIPQVIGLLWLLFYWKRHRRAWDWKRQGMLVLVVSITCSYYSYPYDEILVLPALIAAFLTGNKRAFIVCFTATNIGYAIYLFQIAGSLGFSYVFLSWTATAWLVTYASASICATFGRRVAEARNIGDVS